MPILRSTSSSSSHNFNFTAMPKKQFQPTSLRSLCRFALKTVIIVTVLIFIFAYFRLQTQPQFTAISSSSPAFRHDDTFQGTPKLAFLFLVKKNLPLDFLWDCFFQNGDEEKYSIYVHSEPGFAFDKSTTKSHFFYGRQLKYSIKVGWGESTMIQAERLLFKAALEDPANQRFVLLSDSCVPLYNFTNIYNYIMASPRSFVDSFIDAKEGRYNVKMTPTIPKVKWRKGSQWIAVVRRDAEVLVSDEIIFSTFKKLCKRRPPIDIRKGKLNNKLQKQHNCIPDEHYVQTLLSMSGLEGELEQRTLTYTVWNESNTPTENTGWHPMTFSYETAGPEGIKEIKDINHVFYETEFRTEWCRTNSTYVPCFLFARKFSQGAAMRLLSEGVFGPCDATLLPNGVV